MSGNARKLINPTRPLIPRYPLVPKPPSCEIVELGKEIGREKAADFFSELESVFNTSPVIINARQAVAVKNETSSLCWEDRSLIFMCRVDLPTPQHYIICSIYVRYIREAKRCLFNGDK